MASILFVEDEATIRDLIGGALVDAGFHVTFAEDGTQALEEIAAAEFHAVVCDVSMPGRISGVDVVEHITSRRPDARTILVSGHARAHLPPIPPGVEFLPKPYRLSQLLALLPPA